MSSATEASRVASLVGQVIDGRYRVDSVLALGGMGAVLRGTHLVLGQSVAIKVMLDATMRDPTMRERVFREARILAQVRSPSIASIFDAGLLPDGTLYIVMELLEGQELEEAIVKRSLSLPQAARLLAQVCEGLADAHAQGIVHRDLKPANIFVVKKSSGETAAKIIDFGISKRVGEMSETTTVTTIIGSPYYMAPEQANSSRDVDHRADIWSLGVILFRIVVGRLPFEGTIAAILAAIRSSEPVFPPTIDPAYRAVIQRCLTKDLSRRYESALELRAALLPLAEARPARESLPSWPPAALPGRASQVPGQPGQAGQPGQPGQPGRGGQPGQPGPVAIAELPGSYEEAPGTERTKLMLDLGSTGASAVALGGRSPFTDEGEMVTTKMSPPFQRGRPSAPLAPQPSMGGIVGAPSAGPAPLRRQTPLVLQTVPMPAQPVSSASSARPSSRSTPPTKGSPRRSLVVWSLVGLVAVAALGAIAAHILSGSESGTPAPASR